MFTSIDDTPPGSSVLKTLDETLLAVAVTSYSIIVVKMDGDILNECYLFTDFLFKVGKDRLITLTTRILFQLPVLVFGAAK